MENWKEIWDVASPFVYMVLILLIGHFIIVYALKAIGKAFNKSNHHKSLVKFFLKTINIVLHLLIILSALNSIGVSTTGIVATLSAAVFAVSVALKDSLSNVAGGILLLLSPRFSTGDYISAGGNEGNVVLIDLLHTDIKTLDGKTVSIPNGVLINQSVVNYSREPVRRVDITFPVPYDCDVKEAKKAALKRVSEHPYVLDSPDAPFVRVQSYGDSSVNIIVRAWCETKNYWDVMFGLTEQVRDAFLEKNIEIPYNQLDVHIKNDPEGIK